MRIAPPFVLLDDARPGGRARLYRAPVEIVVADTPEAVAPALARLREAAAEGLHAAGYLAYEAAAGIDPRLATVAGGGRLLWFGLFERMEAVAGEAVAALLPDPAGAWAGAPEPLIGADEYVARFERVRALIEAGDLYQANLSLRARVPVIGDPHALYARLRGSAAAGYGALVDTGETQLLCLSPELFFEVDGEQLRARPMKGTARRGDTAEGDRQAAAALAGDAKQRAENLMIVDLMRNDLARVAAPGSVEVDALFRVERYPTVHQMVSDVSARLAPGRNALDVLAALFPCGSITGAPKVRATEVIAEVEREPRGIYTGAIGRFDPDGDASFAVAIRTLALGAGADHATLGLGSGIVADSRADAEWDECLAKGAFVTAGQRAFDLVETMAFDPDSGLTLLEGHLSRMKASADAFGFRFDRHAARNELQAATFRLRGARRIRLLLSPSGAIAVEVAPMPAVPDGPVEVAVMPLPVGSADFRLRHKTTARGFYDRAREDSGTFEVLFVDADGFLTEGSFTNLFVPRDSTLVTPPLVRGLLPGVLRADLIESGRAVEGDITPDDLAGGFFVGNALRGLMPAAVARSAAAGL